MSYETPWHLILSGTFLFLFSSIISLSAQQLEITELSPMPMKTSNNAVCEGLIGGKQFVFSFAGIDSTRLFSGIHNRCFKLDVELNSWSEIDPLPDPLGKIACSANRIKDVIYIVGGYHVQANGNEISSRLVHRYDLSKDQFIENAAPIPLAIDDQVQAVWRDSLLYVITGWSNSTNVVNVQIYNPESDSWTAGTSLPNIPLYKVFGGSGTIVEDSIFYHGGARLGGSFPANYGLIKGVINPMNPTQIEWTDISPDYQTVAYRTACTQVFNDIHWVGGSEVTYNYNGIAYNGSGPVVPAARILISNKDDRSVWYSYQDSRIPMDLRGIASLNDSTKILAGGMLAGPEVTNKTLMLEWTNDFSSSAAVIESSEHFAFYPNPSSEYLFIDQLPLATDDIYQYKIYDIKGNLLDQGTLNERITISKLQEGMYFLQLGGRNDLSVMRFFKK